MKTFIFIMTISVLPQAALSKPLDGFISLLHRKCLVSNIEAKLSRHSVGTIEAVPVPISVGEHYFEASATQVADIPLRPIERSNGKSIWKSNELTRLMGTRNKHLSYISDISGRIFVSDMPLNHELPSLIHNIAPDAHDEVIVLKEAGDISYNPAKKDFEFKPQIKGPEVVEPSLIENKGRGVALVKSHTMTKDEILSCSTYNKLNNHGAAYILSKVGMDAAFQSASMYLTGRFNSPAGVRSWEASMGWTGIHDAMATGADYLLIKKATSLPLAITSRYAEATVEWFLSEYWNRFAMGKYDTGTHPNPGSEFKHLMLKSVGLSHEDESNKSLSQQIANANFQYNLMRVPMGFAIDRWFVNSLPALTMKLCSINPKLLILVNGASLRLLDRASNQLLQVSFQNMMIGDALKKASNQKSQQSSVEH